MASGDPVRETLLSGRPALSVNEYKNMYQSKRSWKTHYTLLTSGVSTYLTVRNLDLAARILLYFINLFASSANDFRDRSKGI